jgi:nucleoid-associated protein YgaU
MSSYYFPADAGRRLPDNATGAEAIVALLDRLGLPHENITINRKGDTVTVEGHVPDGAAEERLVLAVGNIEGVSWVQNRLTRDHYLSLFDTIGSFANLPAGAAGTESAVTAIHQAQLRGETRFGPCGSLFYTIEPGDTLASIAGRYYGVGDPDAALRLLEANAPMLADEEAMRPGMVLRIPPH